MGIPLVALEQSPPTCFHSLTDPFLAYETHPVTIVVYV